MAASPRLLYRLESGEVASLGSDQLHASDPDVVGVEGNLVRGIAPGSVTLTIDGERELPVQVTAPVNPDWVAQASHPRLRFTAAELAKITRGGALPLLGVDLGGLRADLLARAEQYLIEDSVEIEYPRPDYKATIHLLSTLPQPGAMEQPYGFTDYPFWTMLSRRIEVWITTLSLAWSLTGDERFGQRAKGLLLALCTWTKWHEYDKPTNNLSLPHFTIAAATAYDELFDLLNAEERATVRQAILELGLRPMGHWIGERLDHNINVLMAVGMVYGALATFDEMPEANQYLVGGRDTLRWYLEQRESTATTEGLVYISYAMSTLLMAGMALRRSIGDTSLLDGSYMREILPELYFRLYGGAGGHANLADADHHVQPARLMAQLCEEFDDSRAAWLIAQDLRTEPGLFPILQRDHQPLDPAKDLTTASYCFEQTGWTALRTGWDEEAIVATHIASASTASHTHLDQNHFIVNVGGEWLLTDPGYQDYAPGPTNLFTNQTFGHNGLLVNGEGQSVRGHGRVAAFSTSEALDQVTGDATGAYEGRLKRWLRTIALIKPGYLLVVDDIEVNDPGDRVSVSFHTRGTVQSGGQTVPLGGCEASARYRFSGEHRALDLIVVSESPVVSNHK